jgi:hypothetical protein
MQYLNKTLATYVLKNMQHTDKHTCNLSEKSKETLGTDTHNIRVQPLQHMQHPDLVLQHPHKTLEAYL